MLHLPFFSRGPTWANVPVTRNVPLIPAYCPVPLASVAGPVAPNVPEHVVLLNEKRAWLSALKKPVASATNVPCLRVNLTKSPFALGDPLAVSRWVDPESPI